MSSVLFCWSGGKDSALSLYELRSSRGAGDIRALITTVTDEYDRISMHGVRRELLEAQAHALGHELSIVRISPQADNAQYESRMRETLERYRAGGVSSVAFGDIFLEDLRKYRENNLAQLEMNALFPIWKQDTRTLARRFIDLGFKAIVTCVDTRYLDGSFAGRNYDASFLADLPSGVDPCGENGEFHSFVYDGPIFSRPVPFIKGDTVLRDNRFNFCDLVPYARNDH